MRVTTRYRTFCTLWWHWRRGSAGGTPQGMTSSSGIISYSAVRTPRSATPNDGGANLARLAHVHYMVVS